MPIDYEKRRAKWKKLAEELPGNLRGRISLRNVETVSKLSPPAQATLAGALDSGLKQLSMAVAYLKDHPNAAVDELLCLGSSDGRTPGGVAPQPQDEAAPTLIQNESVTPVAPPDAQDSQFVSQIIQGCFPGMNHVAAEALSGSPSMAGVLLVARSHRMVLESSHIHADFVLVVFYALLQQALCNLNDLIASNTAHQQAVRQCGIYLTSSQHLESQLLKTKNRTRTSTDKRG